MKDRFRCFEAILTIHLADQSSGKLAIIRRQADEGTLYCCPS